MAQIIELEEFRKRNLRLTRKDEALSIADEIIAALKKDRAKILRAKREQK